MFAQTVAAQGDLSRYQSKISKYKYSKHLDSAKIYFDKALPLALAKKDSVTIFYFYKSMGDAYEHHLFRDSTLLMYDFCEKFIPKNNTKLKSFLLNDRGYTYNLLHDYEKALQLRIKALEIAEKSQNKGEIANISTNLANDFSKLNLNKQAEIYYKKAIAISKLSKSISLLEFTHRYYGIYLLKISKNNLAFENINLASKYAIQTKDSITMAFAWSSLSTCYWINKKVNLSFFYAKKAEGIWERRAENIDLSEICMQQGSYYTALGNYQKAEYYLKKAEKYILTDLYFNEKLFSNFATLYNKNGNADQAFVYLLKAKNCLEKIKENENKSKVASLSIQFETGQKEKQIREQKLKNKFKNLELIQKSTQLQIISVILFFLVIIIAIIFHFFRKIKSKNELLFTTNEQLEQLVDQKKILIKEVHHRVKNNLTTLSSLLFLQAKATDNAEVKSVLNECQLRIQSMALIHQSLYEDAENDQVDFYIFLEQLLDSLAMTFQTSSQNVTVTLEKNKVVLDVSIAIFLGLILNELVTNSFKYAFVNKKDGNININLDYIDKKLVVIYTDNGCGLPNGFNENKGGFGFKIIQILVQQINANLQYDYQNNLSRFTIQLPNEQ